jgi:hypothetical protein
MKKAIPLTLDGDPVALASAALRDLAAKHRPHGILPLVHGGCEGTEIVRSHEVPGRGLHGRDG